MIRAQVSNHTAARLEAAAAFVDAALPRGEIVVVGPDRDAVDDFALHVARKRTALFGLHRFGLAQLVNHFAVRPLAEAGRTEATRLGEEAVAARVAFEALGSGSLERFAEVVRCPGFARALRDTLLDLRLAGVTADALESQPQSRDLAVLLRAYERALEMHGIADRADRLQAACAALEDAAHAPLRALPMLWLDVPIHDAAHRAFLAGLAAGAPEVLVTVPAGDEATLEHLEQLGVAIETPRARRAPAAEVPRGSLERLRTYLFAEEPPPEAEPDDSVRFFSAPGEARECTEIARLVLQAAREGTRFDDIAVFLRAPEAYSAHLDTALRRAGIPAHFARGTKRPDPAGRAFLALLACRAERFSAKRFSEYLSFAQVPELDASGAPPADRELWAGPEDESLGRTARVARERRRRDVPETWVQADLFAAPPAGASEADSLAANEAHPGDARAKAHDEEPDDGASSGASAGGAPPAGAGSDGADSTDAGVADSDDVPAVEGTLRTPWKWEEVLVEAAVIGGRDRWRRRLTGFENELRMKLEEVRREEPGSPRLAAIERDLRHLAHLERFALPVVEALAELPENAPWRDWLDGLEVLAPRVLRDPQRVLSVLAELRPMNDVGPVGIAEVREVLTERLTLLEQDPPPHRWGRVFVATPDLARGRSFRIVFVPGLAERTFPQHPREDPLLLDAVRRRVSDALDTQEDRGRSERLLLRLALAAARERVVLSYPRVDAVEARPRVPSFYGLDVIRATRGFLPDFESFERETAARGAARLAWPAPPDPDLAIDAVEHDLAVLGPLLHARQPNTNRGRARYLLQLSDTLARSLRGRWLRWGSKWTPQDGLIRTTPAIEAAMAAHRLTERPYSVTALQAFAACPYRFLLGAIHRLEPRRDAAALVRLDPMTRGRIFHRVQSDTLRRLREAGLLPLDAEHLDAARDVLDATMERLESRYRERLAPAIPRVWMDEMETMRADLRVWLQRMTAPPRHGPTTHALPTTRPWEPVHFEFTFGLRDVDEHAEAASPDHAPVTLAGGWKLRGAIDMVERSKAVPNPFTMSFATLAASTGGVQRIPEGTSPSRDDASSEADAGPEEIEVYRVTDHKTGANHTPEGMITLGGEVLQPVMYALAAEALLQRPVAEGRLYFCTTQGGFSERIIPMTDMAREYGDRVFEIINRAVVNGWLMPMPRQGACARCDFQVVCGPHEETRSQRKNPPSYKDLQELRDLT